MACFVLRLRSPRPRRRRLARQPGFIASGAASLVSLVVVLFHVMYYLKGTDTDGLTMAVVESVAAPSGPAVLGAWWVLALGGSWRGEAGWIDRLGLIVGSSWIIYWAFDALIFLFW